MYRKSAMKLSDCLLIFNPNHLIMRDLFDCTKTLSKFYKCSIVFNI